jgi:hypothetical protein
VNYAELSARTEEILTTCQQIINQRPEHRDMERATAGITIAAVYAQLADTAARVEATRQVGGDLTLEDRGIGRGAYADQVPDAGGEPTGAFDGSRFH